MYISHCKYLKYEFKYHVYTYSNGCVLIYVLQVYFAIFIYYVLTHYRKYLFSVFFYQRLIMRPIYCQRSFCKMTQKITRTVRANLISSYSWRFLIINQLGITIFNQHGSAIQKKNAIECMKKKKIISDSVQCVNSQKLKVLKV